MRRVAATILLVFGLAACGGGSAPREAERPVAAALPAAGTGLSCMPWPNAAGAPDEPGLLRSAEQEVPGTDSGFGPPVQVTVGLACVTLPSSASAAGLYCGAAERGGTPRPCLVGEECAIGNIMVTEVSRSQEAGGTMTCAVFENWLRTGTRSISLWVRPR